MKARLLTNAMQLGHVSRDCIRLVREDHHPSTPILRPHAQRAVDVLESFQDTNSLPPADPAVPVRRLVRVLTEGLRGTLSRLPEDSRIEGARLFRGCRVRLAGIPERVFVVVDFDWDRGEVRIKELGGGTQYLLPWDCLEFVEEQGE